MSLLLRGAGLRPSRLFRGGRPFLAALLSALATTLFAHDAGIVVRELDPLVYDEARRALLDALIDEGLAPPTVSAFGDMLARTAADLRHPAELYERAEIFTFCSARIASLLVREDVSHIALCPLTIALYALPARPGVTFVAYRPPPPASPAARLAQELLQRITTRMIEYGGLRP